MKRFTIGLAAPTPEDIEKMLEPLTRKRVKPGECDHPKCTGVHSHSRPRSEWCPRTDDQDRQWDNSTDRAFYKSMWALRTGLSENQATAEALGASPTDYDPWAEPISGARNARLRKLKAAWEESGLIPTERSK